MDDDTKKHQAIYLRDYSPPEFFIDSVELKFDIQSQHTLVTSGMVVTRNLSSRNKNQSLILDGVNLELISIQLNDSLLSNDNYKIAEKSLTLPNVPDNFTLIITTKIKPHLNTALNGLYQSKNLLCTQCEAHGFRYITYFIDRPDVMARYTTTIVADKTRYPVLLSNGNNIGSGESDLGRHWVKWEDPFKKPCYLFALVAGDLVYLQDQYITTSGRTITLRIYVEHGQQEKCHHAMNSLKKAMRWDEKIFGREYDLAIFMIVAVSDFNAGAMENKGLNIFNAKYILANPETATDIDYENIEAVVAHEYFHNWTGNRITCRDWFQLSLKEGLTVFREQEFMRDMISRDVKRIHDVQVLWNQQFPEDTSPMAHPVQPDSYIEVNNFYTPTVYNKGAEVIRMIHTLLGVDGFRRGMDLYFSRHDGQAVTIEDFVQSFEDANQVDLKQFRLWYHQAGTPELHITSQYQQSTQSFELTVEQSCPKTPGQECKKPFHIPFAIGLLDQSGNELSLQLEDENEITKGTKILEIKQQKECFRFINLKQNPIPSLLRDFSAPVKMTHNLRDDELLFLLSNDPNGFSRWDAGQSLVIKSLLSAVKSVQQGQPIHRDPLLINAFQTILEDNQIGPALKAHLLMFPDENFIADLLPVIDASAIHIAHRSVQLQFVQQLKGFFLASYHQNLQATYKNDATSIAKRSLKNICLAFLMRLAESDIIVICHKQFYSANNMSDKLAALNCLSHLDIPERETALTDFYQEWSEDELVLDKWFMVQARSELPKTLDNVKQLIQHPKFSMTNPNKVRALLRTFAMANPAYFHAQPELSYEFYTDQIIKLDGINPHVASSLLTPYTHWKRWCEPQRTLQKQQLEKILKLRNLSSNVHEIIIKCLAD